MAFCVSRDFLLNHLVSPLPFDCLNLLTFALIFTVVILIHFSAEFYQFPLHLCLYPKPNHSLFAQFYFIKESARKNAVQFPHRNPFSALRHSHFCPLLKPVYCLLLFILILHQQKLITIFVGNYAVQRILTLINCHFFQCVLNLINADVLLFLLNTFLH